MSKLARYALIAALTVMTLAIVAFSNWLFGGDPTWSLAFIALWLAWGAQVDIDFPREPK